MLSPSAEGRAGSEGAKSRRGSPGNEDGADAVYHPFLPPLRAFWLVSGVRGDAGVDAAYTCPSYTQGN